MEGHAPKAVFLSYAREDAASGRRIAEALRSSGIEVWFDENELRGGDAWDQKIRHQIKDCSLFLAIISVHTQERGEGYFRLEWNLAVERTRLMMEGVPFLVPVVVDETPESTDMVPEPFLRVQWTRLPKGLPSPQFVEQVNRLLALPHKPVAPTARAEVASHAPARAGRSSFPMWPVVAVGVVGFALVAYVLTRPHDNAPATTSIPVAEAKFTPAAPAANDKSIAVLPFANLSDDKENTAFFSDGMQEDILTTLANIRELRVVSRTSVMEYRDTTKKIPQIARELGVAYILEGSVRRTGNQVRITGQLIRAATDEHLWAKSYDRELTTKELFGIQATLATEIAGELKATLSPQEQTLVAQKSTESLAAYDLYLKAREAGRRATLPTNRRDVSTGVLKKKEALLQAAVLLDAKFAEAWGELAQVHAQFYFGNSEHTAARQDQAKVAIDKAVARAPASPDIIRNLGNYYLFAHRDYARATAEFERLARLQPNNSEVYFSLGEIQQREAKWPAALANFRKATQLDPGNVAYASGLVAFLRGGRRWDEAISEQRRVVALSPEGNGRLREAAYLAELPFHARGSTREMKEWLAARTPEEAESQLVLNYRGGWARTTGDYAEASRLDVLLKRAWFDVTLTLAVQGDWAGARAAAEREVAKQRARLETEPNNTVVLYSLGLAEAVLGHKDEALRCARRSVELVPEERDAVLGADLNNKLALIYAWAGEIDKAIEETARLLRTPNSIADVYMMKYDPWWFPLRKDPRFLALLNDPKNNAPLF